jgi:hypothetical protein
MSISSEDDTNSTEESDSKFDLQLDPDVYMHKEDDVDAWDGVDLDGDVDMERDGDDEVQKEEQEEDEEDEDQDEDDGKEPRTIGQGEMVNTSADDVDTMVDDQPIELPEPGQEISDNTLQPQTSKSHPGPETMHTHPLSGREHCGHVMPEKPRPAVPTL